MPAYRSRTVLEVARNVRAFLELNAGLVRGEVPDSSEHANRQLREVQSQVGQLRKQLADKNRQLQQVREQPPGEGRAAAGAGANTPDAAGREKKAGTTIAGDPRDHFLGRVAEGRSFADVGGLYGTVSEKVSAARRHGATELTIIDIVPEGNELWQAFSAATACNPIVLTTPGGVDAPGYGDARRYGNVTADGHGGRGRSDRDDLLHHQDRDLAQLHGPPSSLRDVPAHHGHYADQDPAMIRKIRRLIDLRRLISIEDRMAALEAQGRDIHDRLRNHRKALNNHDVRLQKQGDSLRGRIDALQRTGSIPSRGGSGSWS